MAVALLVIPVSGAFAATTAEVNVTATPSYLAITNSATDEALGTLEINTTTWAIGSEPVDPLDDAECFSTITNTGSVAVDITIKADNFTNPDLSLGWTLAGTKGEDIVVMKAGFEGENIAEMQVVTVSYAAFIANLADGVDIDWEFSLETGTFTDGLVKSTKIYLSAAPAA